MEQDPYDLDKLRLDQADLPTARAKLKKRRQHFAMMPLEWMRRLTKAQHRGTFLLAFLLIYEHWRRGGQPIAVSNVLVTDWGVPRRSKARALTELEQLGLVELVRHRGRSPRAELRHMT